MFVEEFLECEGARERKRKKERKNERKKERKKERKDESIGRQRQVSVL